MQNTRDILICCALVFVGVCAVTAKEKQAQGEKTYIRVIGNSGKILMGRKGQSEAVVIEMDSMQELNATGKVVGAGKAKHSFRSFASQEFDFSELQDTTYQSLKCKSFDFNAVLEGPNATLKVTTYLFFDSGEIDIGDSETDEIKIGSIKWNIELKNWQFCGSGSEVCKKGNKNETGAYIDFEISLKSKIKPKKLPKKAGPAGKNRTRPASFDLGDASLELSNQIKVDGAWVKMEAGYPMVSERGSKQIIVFRFPKFTSELLYDPLLNLYDSGATIPSPSTAFLASLMVITALLNLYN